METILDIVQQEVVKHNAMTVSKRKLYLAYIMFHMLNPGLHPDDYMSEEGGYQGWSVLLVDAVKVRNAGTVPLDFWYCTAFLKIEAVLRELAVYHDHLIEESQARQELHEARQLLCSLNSLSVFLQEMKSSELDEAVDCATKLYLHHANEDFSDEEEACTPAGTLKIVADVLNWIQQFK